MKPWLLETAEEYKGKVKFVAVSLERAPDLFETYDVPSMPTFVAIKDGKEVKRIPGDKSQIKEFLENAL